MTIPTETSRMDYVGNGATTVYPYTFKIDDETELLVVTADTNGVETTLVLNTDYTVSGVGSQSGGNVTLTTVLASGYALTIQVQTAITQETDIKNQGAFSPEVIEDAFDHNIRVSQMINNSIGRAVRLPLTLTGVDTNLANLSPGEFVRLSEDGTQLEGAQAFADLTDATQDGTTYGRKNGAWAAVPTSFWATILNATEIAITAATAATANRMHVVSGTSGDYAITLPSAPASGTVVGLRVKDYTAASKLYTLDAGGTVKIAGRTRYLVLTHTNVVLLMFDGTDWQPLVLNLDSPWVTVGNVSITGTGSNPSKGTTSVDTIRCCRSGKNCIAHMAYRQSGAGSSGTGAYLFSIPHTADTASVPSADTNFGNATVGSASAEGPGGSAGGSALLVDSTHVVIYSGSSASNGPVGSTLQAMGNAGQNYSYHITYPVTNW